MSFSPGLLDQSIEGQAPALIAGGAHAEAGRDLVFPLDGLALRGRHIARERDEEISCDPLLNRHIVH